MENREEEACIKSVFSAGEVSGDLHGASLAAAIKRIEPEARLFGFGGPQMQAAGVDICCNMQDYNVMLLGGFEKSAADV